ncbi:ISxac3 transposase (plasmid) [Xanthomonas axonopodis Xac29-1]|uniref:ISxac3 transposase n=1 Tax=Xanthomonas axonopodis pv. citri (strain 306) TaxID=190486 RepID=A0AAI7ZJF2_XANAC|nr:ISxac3 transposase [Xanthomonas citri pv. citri str. 306]AGH79846.1 ISxac3 transposase [Xanthomonas axonopodis Xac29-1]
MASGSVYGHRKIAKDLRDLGERCSRHRVHRLMRTEGLRAQVRGGRDLCKKQPKVG